MQFRLVHAWNGRVPDLSQHFGLSNAKSVASLTPFLFSSVHLVLCLNGSASPGKRNVRGFPQFAVHGNFCNGEQCFVVCDRRGVNSCARFCAALLGQKCSVRIYVHILNYLERCCSVDKYTIASSCKKKKKTVFGDASVSINVHFCLSYFVQFVGWRIGLLLHLKIFGTAPVTSRSNLGVIASIVELTCPFQISLILQDCQEYP